MMQTPNPEYKDQATGLRQLFGSSQMPVHLLTCPQRPALTLPLLQWICQDLSERGHNVAWLDEIDLREREDWPLPVPIRFDIGQALGGHVNLASAMRCVRPQLFYGFSHQTRKLTRTKENLQTRMKNSGVNFRTLVVAAHPEVKPARYTQEAHHTVIVDAKTENLQLLMNWMIRIEASDKPPGSWHIVLASKNTGSETALNWLKEVSTTRLSKPVKLLGLAAPETVSIPLAQAWVGQLDLKEILIQHFLSD